MFPRSCQLYNNSADLTICTFKPERKKCCTITMRRVLDELRTTWPGKCRQIGGKESQPGFSPNIHSRGFVSIARVNGPRSSGEARLMDHDTSVTVGNPEKVLCK